MSFNSWRSVRLGDISLKITKGTTPSTIGSNFTSNGINFFRSESIGASKFIDVSKTKFIDEETHRKMLRSQLKESDILFSMAGMFLGKTCLVTKNDVPANINQAVALIRLDNNIADADYVYYYLNQREIVLSINNTSAQSAQPNINLKQIGNITITVPELLQQKRISSILCSLDGKIELNKAINRNLDEMAESLFKRWFVDHEFPNGNGEPYKSSGGEFEESNLGLIPKGWRAGVFSELVNVKYGKDHKKLDDGSIPVYGSGGVMRYVDKVLYSGESVLIPRKGSLNNVIYINEPFWSVDTMFYTEMKLPYTAKFIYFFVRSKDLVSMNVGSAVPSMTTDILNKMPVVIPPECVFEEFDKVASALFDKIHNGIIEIKKLSDIRDSLLPKLMSGEIQVPLKNEYL